MPDNKEHNLRKAQALLQAAYRENDETFVKACDKLTPAELKDISTHLLKARDAILVYLVMARPDLQVKGADE